MKDFLLRQRENLATNLVASALFAVLAALVSWLSNLPPIPVPAWLFLAIAAFGLAWWWFSRQPKKLVQIANKKFGVERIILDGKHFTGCTFDGSELVYRGSANVALGHCGLIGVRMKFEDAADRTAQLIMALYGDPGLRFIAQQILDRITQEGQRLADERLAFEQARGRPIGATAAKK